MSKIVFILSLLHPTLSLAWGTKIHRSIALQAIYPLPAPLFSFYYSHIPSVCKYATSPDVLRSKVKEEKYNHFFTTDYTDSLHHNLSKGNLPNRITQCMQSLTNAFMVRNRKEILKWSGYLCHYVSDGCVPLHLVSDYNGKQHECLGIHALWESSLPLMEQFKFLPNYQEISYIERPDSLVISNFLTNAKLSSTLFQNYELAKLKCGKDGIYTFQTKGRRTIRVFSPIFKLHYLEYESANINYCLNQSISFTALCWYACWVEAGQPPLEAFYSKKLSAEEAAKAKQSLAKWYYNLGSDEPNNCDLID